MKNLPAIDHAERVIARVIALGRAAVEGGRAQVWEHERKKAVEYTAEDRNAEAAVEIVCPAIRYSDDGRPDQGCR